DDGWYTHPEDYSNWEEKCFIVPTDVAHVQKWNGDVIEDQYTNELGALVHNPVEAFIAVRDGSHLSRFGNYNSLAATEDDVDSDINAIRICVPAADAEGADEYTGLRYFENCLTNDTQMTKLYTEEYGRDKWKGDRWDCRTLEEGETCDSVADEAIGPQADVDAWAEVRAACVLDSERNCKTYGTEIVRPMLRHKFMNGDTTVAMWNWVDQPTEYGILGVSQWNINPETGQSFGAGSNVAGSVLQWAVTRGVEMSRMLVDSEDPAAWDWEDLVNPAYENLPSKIWDNTPQDARESESQNLLATRSVLRKEFHEKESDTEVQGTPKLYEKWEMPISQNRFNFSSVKGTKWESKMIPYSILESMFPWSDPNEYNYSDEMKEQLSHMFIPDQTEIEMQRLMQRGENTYFEASFLDGAIIQFLQERQVMYRDMYPGWQDDQKEEYTAAFLGAVTDDLEILMYKGVAEHEMGHSLGLRHNFISSADMWNYKDGYFTTENYPNLMKEEAKLVAELTAAGTDPGVIGDQVYALKRAYPFSPERDADGNYVRLPGTSEEVTPITYNMYVSIMDYQSEPYIHAVGLGKYDYAAIKFVYGRSVEQMTFNGEGTVAMTTDNPVRDAAYPLPILKNISYIKDNGELKKVSDFTDPRLDDKRPLQPSKLVRHYADDGTLVWTLALDVEANDLGEPFLDPETLGYTVKSSDKYIINDGSIYPYLFFSDETRMDEPASNVWDTGYLATDIIRSFRYMDDKYYYLRYFARGNPRFREFRGRNSMKMIYGALFSTYKYVHFLLDLNYNMFQSGWLGGIPRNYDAVCAAQTIIIDEDSLSSKNISTDNKFCEDYRRAVDGKEYWFNADGDFRELTPMEAGDYLAAGMQGVNFLLYDVVYRPDSGTDYLAMGRSGQISENPLLISDKIEPSQNRYWKGSGYVGLDPNMLLSVPASIGRYQKNHWDKQDDPTVYYEKLLRKGYAEQKMVALYTLTNSGWFSSKYRRESMANAIGDGNAPGLEHTKFKILAEVANEDSLIGLSPYCVVEDGINPDTFEPVYKVKKVPLPTSTLLNYLGAAPFFDGHTHDLPTNLCAHYGMITAKDIVADDVTADLADRVATMTSNMVKKVDNASKYEPIHAGWTYYDKTWPLYWGMGNVANISADATIFWKFITLTYPVMERELYPPVDIDEVEVLNSMGNRYYRAKLPVTDMTSEDSVALRRWKEMKAAGATDAEAMCLPDNASGQCLHYCLDDDGDMIPKLTYYQDAEGNYLNRAGEIQEDDPPPTDAPDWMSAKEKAYQHATIDEYGFVKYESSAVCGDAAHTGKMVLIAGFEAMINKFQFYLDNALTIWPKDINSFGDPLYTNIPSQAFSGNTVLVNRDTL
ncbi:MAG: hypothetical protein ACTSWQ_09980, partial [Candidatus Thorarchaeota archaeon]